MAALQWMQWAVTNDASLRVQAALNYIATTIVNEADTVANHAQRMIAAKKMLNGQINIPDFVKLVATDSDLRAVIDQAQDPTDTELLAAAERSLVVMAKAAI